jgi:prevent-host-death family protein
MLRSVRWADRAARQHNDLYNDHMTRKLTATEAKAKILALLDEVASGTEIEITKHGRTVARLVPAAGPHGLRARFAGVASTAAENDDLLTTGLTWTLE